MTYQGKSVNIIHKFCDIPALEGIVTIEWEGGWSPHLGHPDERHLMESENRYKYVYESKISK